MPLRLYIDECVDARIVAGLRRRDVDVTTAADQELLGAGDDGHLERATALGRVVVTADHDFLQLAHSRVQHAQPHPGLIFILPGTGVGAAVRSITFIAQMLEPEDLKNWVEWVSRETPG